MNPEQLAIACMNPGTRNIMRVEMSEDSLDVVFKVMGGDSNERRDLLVKEGVLSLG